MISTTLTNDFRGGKRWQKGTALNIGVFCLPHKDQPGQVPSVDCVSRTWIHLIKDNSLIKVIRAIFLERLFPHSIICNVFLNLIFLLCIMKLSSVVAENTDSCPLDPASAIY